MILYSIYKMHLNSHLIPLSYLNVFLLYMALSSRTPPIHILSHYNMSNPSSNHEILAYHYDIHMTTPYSPTPHTSSYNLDSCTSSIILTHSFFLQFFPEILLYLLITYIYIYIHQFIILIKFLIFILGTIYQDILYS